MSCTTTLLTAALLAPLAGVGAEDATKAVDRPNIVYLLADQWRGAATGYAGDPNVKTPNLDRLAKDSLNFSNAVSVCPVCTPYRAALMTGRYPTSTGMFLNDAHLPDEEICFAEVFSSAGYSTGYIGKWHLDGYGRDAYVPPERRQGWDYWKAAECDHNYNKSHYYAGSSDKKQFWEGYDAFAQTKDAQAYIRDNAKGPKPFVLMVSYGMPHHPHATAPKDYKALYPRKEKIELPPNVPAEHVAEAQQEAQGYYAHCTALDKCVGDILQTLEEAGIADRTVFVFTSDHGETLGAHGEPPTGKQVAYSESALVPFLLRFPALGGNPGRVVVTPLTTPDILPTLLGLANVAVPKTVEGEDLSEMLREGREIENRAALYMSVAPFSIVRDEYRAIRTSRHTYVRNLAGPWLLFDDEKDPWQMDNLVARPECAALCDELDRRLQERLEKIGDEFRPARVHLDEWGYQVPDGGSVNHTKIRPQTPKRRAAAVEQQLPRGADEAPSPPEESNK